MSEVELGRLLSRTARLAGRSYRNRAAEMQLAPRQASAILAVVETPGLSLGSLAERLGADQATASALVDRLLAAGLVRRETDPVDRRRARLQPTETAMRFAKRIANARRESEDLLRQALGPEDTEALARILEKLLARLIESLNESKLVTAAVEGRT